MATGTLPIDEATYTGYIGASYVSNSYASKTSVERIFSFLFGTFAFVQFNLALETAMPTGTDFVTIGNLGYSLKQAAYFIVPSQNGTGHMLVMFTTSGDIKIANSQGQTLPQAFYRTVIPVLLA